MHTVSFHASMTHNLLIKLLFDLDVSYLHSFMGNLLQQLSAYSLIDKLYLTTVVSNPSDRGAHLKCSYFELFDSNSELQQTRRKSGRVVINQFSESHVTLYVTVGYVLAVAKKDYCLCTACL